MTELLLIPDALGVPIWHLEYRGKFYSLHTADLQTAKRRVPTAETLSRAQAEVSLEDFKDGDRTNPVMGVVPAAEGVYFARAQGTANVKIGYSANMHQRLSSLSTGCPYVLEFIGWTEGTRSVERKLHRELAHKRIKGEWFTECPEILERIQHRSA